MWPWRRRRYGHWDRWPTNVEHAQWHVIHLAQGVIAGDPAAAGFAERLAEGRGFGQFEIHDRVFAPGKAQRLARNKSVGRVGRSARHSAAGAMAVEDGGEGGVDFECDIAAEARTCQRRVPFCHLHRRAVDDGQGFVFGISVVVFCVFGDGHPGQFGAGENMWSAGQIRFRVHPANGDRRFVEAVDLTGQRAATEAAEPAEKPG